MKNQLLTLILALLFLNLFGQDCDLLLKDGLYAYTQTTTRTSFDQDMKSYFSSETFKSDMKSGKWGATLTIPIEGVPISIGADSDESSFSEFQARVVNATSFSLSMATYVSVTQRLPNLGLYEAYIQCQADPLKKGLIQGKKIETEEMVIFPFYFRPQSPNEKSPKITSLTIEPKGSVIDLGGLKVGKRLPSFYMKVIARRSDVNEIVFNLQTESGDIGGVSSPKRNSKYEIPIGTIITSFLSFDRFRESIGEVGPWKATEKWSPCDGRPVPNSQYSEFASPSVPDLRGYFLRGLNSFDPNPPVGVSSTARIDPTPNRTVGSTQPDAIIAHTHQYKKVQDRTMSFNVSTNGDMGMFHGVFNDKTVTHQDPPGETETRPKNIAVYYYIKVN